MADTLPACPVCGVSPTWHAVAPGRIRFAYGCDVCSHDFEIGRAPAASVEALKLVVEQHYCVAYAETMAMAAAMGGSRHGGWRKGFERAIERLKKQGWAA